MLKCIITGATGVLGEEFLNALPIKYSTGEVVLIGRNFKRLDEQKQFLESKRFQCKVISCDLFEIDNLIKECNSLKAKGFIPNLIINCAGVGLKELAYNSSVESQLKLIRLNVEALTMLTLFFLSSMIVKREGNIINISSFGAFLPSPGAAVYSATKSYVNSLSMAIDYECKGTGVRVFTICPGAFLKDSDYQAQILRPGLFRKYRTMKVKSLVEKIFNHTNLQDNSLYVPGLFNKILKFFVNFFGIENSMRFVPLFLKGKLK